MMVGHADPPARHGVRQWDIEAVEAWLRWRSLGRLAPILSERNLR